MSKMPRVVSATPRLQARATAARRARRGTWLRRARWAAAVAAPLVLLWWVLLGSSLFGVDKLVVSGEHRLTVAEVTRAAAVPRGMPLARVDTAAVARRIRTLDTVASVTVTRSWPNHLRVTVVERTAAVVVQEGGHYDVLDDQGVQVESVTTPPRGVIRLQAGTAPQTREAALDVVRTLPLPLRRVVQVVRASSPTNVSLVLAGGRVVVWGSADQSPAKAAAAMALLKLPGRVYDVSSPSVVTRR